MKKMSVWVYTVEGADICSYEQLKSSFLGHLLFQDSDVNNNASNSTTSLATNTLSKDDNVTIPNVQIKRNGFVISEEHHTQGLTDSLVNQTISFNTQNPQDQCWETYVGQVCNCFIVINLLHLIHIWQKIKIM